MTDKQNPYLNKTEGGWEITEAGHEFLSKFVSDSRGEIYALTDQAPSVTTAAAMARLSRSPDDMRVIWLNEFALLPEKAEGVMQRVIDGYGDDSVQQLSQIRVVVENPSNILTKKLERGRLAAYLERSTRYVYYDQKRNGRYMYHTPSNLRPGTKKQYEEAMDQIFDGYSSMVRNLTAFYRKKMAPEKPFETKGEETAWLNATKAKACDAARSLLPAAAQSTVGIVGTAQAVDNMIMRLLSENLTEAQEAGRAILREVRKIAPEFFQRTDKADRGGAISNYRRNTRSELREFLDLLDLPNPRNREASAFDGTRETSVILLKATPADELVIVPEILFGHIQLSHDSRNRIFDSLTDHEKHEILRSYIGNRLNRRHRPGRALENIHYTWEIVGDYGSFRDLQRHRMVDDFDWQDLNPYMGYAIPPEISEAGLEQEYRKCFQLSADTYENLMSAGYYDEAQYAVLFGYRMRYKFTENAREAFHIHELRSSVQAHPAYRYIVLEMHRQIAEVHPTIAGGMRFVNQNDTQELVRLESELATQRKLAQLDDK